MKITEGYSYIENNNKCKVKIKRVVLPYMNQYSDLDNLLGLVEFDCIEGDYYINNCTYYHFRDNFTFLKTN